MQIRKRVECLEARLLPPDPVNVHIVGSMVGETEAAACARHWEPIGEDDLVIFLVPGVRDEAA